MPILKPKTGHTGCAGIKRYLERDGRALAEDFLNFEWTEEGRITPGDNVPEDFDWAKSMDETRHAFGHDKPYRDCPARTFKHFIISPDPKDKITLDELRKLAGTWLTRHFPHHEAVIVYHDDNEHHVPHAHVVVNCTNLVTGRKLQTPNPKALNRDLQEIAKELGLQGFDNEERRVVGSEKSRSMKPRTLMSVRRSRAELRIREEGGYSWVADIRDRVDIAKHISSDEAEFKEKLLSLGVTVDDGKSRRHCPDWVYGLADQPTRRACGETLGVLYGKSEINLYFLRRKRMPTKPEVRQRMFACAREALVLNNLEELHELATAITLCRNYRVSSIEGLDVQIERVRKMGEASHGSLQKARLREADALVRVRDFMAEHDLLPLKQPPVDEEQRARRSTRSSSYSHLHNGRENRSHYTHTPQRSSARTIHRDYGRDR